MRKETFPSSDNKQNNRSPLKVFSEEVPQGLDMDEAAKLAAQMSVTTAQLLSGAELPKAAIAQKYICGQPLVDDEKFRQMPINMRNLHAWYPIASKREQSMLVAKVEEEYYFHEELIHIEFSELFQLMNQDALDKSLMSCYCL
jgi:hypothetical protein